MKKYAVQRISNGQVIDYADSIEQASFWMQEVYIVPLLLVGVLR